jgi:hypothetical protein
VYPTTTCTIPFFNSFSQWNWQKVFEVTYTKNPPTTDTQTDNTQNDCFHCIAGIAGGGELSRRRMRRRKRRSELAPHQLTLVDVFILVPVTKPWWLVGYGLTVHMHLPTSSSSSPPTSLPYLLAIVPNYYSLSIYIPLYPITIPCLFTYHNTQLHSLSIYILKYPITFFVYLCTILTRLHKC